MKTSPAITNFNGGELSPLLIGRADFKNYGTGCRHMRNFVPSPQGPARRRMGTRFVAEVKNSNTRTWLGKFVFNNAQSYVVEFGDGYVRFFSQHGAVLAGGGGVFELATPWPAANLTDANGCFALRMVQSGDVLYVVHKTIQPAKIQRQSANSFILLPLIPSDGPFEDVNPNQSVTMQANSVGGFLVSITASAPSWVAGDQNLIGTFFRLEAGKVDVIPAWEPAKVVAVNDLCRADGKTYQCTVAGTTGTVRPTHDSGEYRDGNPGAQWRYADPGYGWGQIQSIPDTTHLNVIPVQNFPYTAAAPYSTNRWAFQPWNGSFFGDPTTAKGYPDSVTFYRERLVLAKGRQIWGSVAGDFESFADRDPGGIVSVDMSFRFDTTSDRADDIVWISPDVNALLVGTGAAEFAVYEVTTTDAFGPGNAAVRKQSEHGSKRVRTCFVDDSTMYVQASGRKIRDLHMAESVNIKWLSTDMNIVAEHVGRSFAGNPDFPAAVNIIDMAYQQEPDSVLWTAMADGRFAGFTLNREQEIRGWHPHRIGGFVDQQMTQFAMVESVVTIPAPDLARDELWMIVRRYVNGALHRYVEYMEKAREEGDNPEEAFYVDAGLSFHGTRSGVLTPGAGANVAGTIDVPFTTTLNSFSAADIGKYIHTTYLTEDITGQILWKKSSALITSYIDPKTVHATILSPSPAGATGSVPNGKVVGVIDNLNGYGYVDTPGVTFFGGGGAGAAGNASMTLKSASVGFGGSGGGGYSPTGIYQVVGGVFTRPALVQPIITEPSGQVLGWQVIDGGDYSVIPTNAHGIVLGAGAPNFNWAYADIVNTGGAPGAGVSGIAGFWGVGNISMTNNGAGYSFTPGITLTPVHAPFVAANMAAVIDQSSLVPGALFPLSAAAGAWRVTATTISGLGHLEGQVVDVAADGAAMAQKIVAGGSIVLDFPASVVHVGLPCPAVLQPMAFEPMSYAINSTQGKSKRIPRVSILFHESLGCKYGRDELSTLDQVTLREPIDPMNQSLPLFTGYKRVNWPSGYDEFMLVTIIADQPLPCTIAGIIPRITTEDDS